MAAPLLLDYVFVFIFMFTKGNYSVLLYSALFIVMMSIKLFSFTNFKTIKIATNKLIDTKCEGLISGPTLPN